MAVLWTQTENTAGAAVFVSTQDVTVTFDKTQQDTFSIRIEGPFAMLTGVEGPFGASRTPDEFVANWVQDRCNAGDTIT